jgi:transposase
LASLQKRTVKGIDYWSLVESKRINGKPRPVVIEYFGNTKSFTEKLINSRNENKILKSYSHGDTHALMKIAENLGIGQILDDIFKSRMRNGLKRNQTLLLIALQSVCNPSSKSELGSWIKSTSLQYDYNLPTEALISNHFWEQMSDITESELATAEDTIVKRIFSRYNFGLEKIALDYTNYFSYISSTNDKCKLAKRGHNKQKRNDLRQYSLALITTKESGLPLCSHIYEGNKNDKTIFTEYLEILRGRIPNYNPNSITLVFDGGSNTKENFKALETHYICSFSLSSCKNLYDIELSKYSSVTVNSNEVKCYRITQEIWDKERECILTYSNSLYRGQLKELDENITQACASFDQLNEKLCNPKSRISKTKEVIQSKIKTILAPKHMDTILSTRIYKNNNDDFVSRVEYFVNEEMKAKIASKYFGKKLLITDQKSWSTADIIKTYREQDCIEKILRTTKDSDHCAIRPQFHYTDQKIRVHIFCCLLGLILATILHKEVVSKGFAGSKFYILDVLSGIRRCWIKDKDSTKVTYVMEEMDAVQTQLWNIIESI